MQSLRFVPAWVCGLALAGALCWPQAPPSSASRPSASTPLVLAGGTVVDVSDWGRSAKDLQDAIVVVSDGRIVAVGSRTDVPIPKGAWVIDCTGKYLIPGLVDGFAGMNSQGQANANLYMGVTTVVASADDRRGHLDFAANPSPHLYLLDSIGTTDNWSLLIGHREWTAKLKEGAHPVELSPEDTARQLNDTARLGTRVLWLGWDLTAANTQWIVAHAHQMGLVTYGEFISTPYRVGIEAGVDALLHMSRYEPVSYTHLSARTIPNATSTWALPRSTRSSLPPVWPLAATARSALFTPHSCSGHSIPSCMTSACKSFRWCFAWIAPDSPVTMVLRIMGSSTSAICAKFPGW